MNLADFPFKGGCLGCFGCAADGRCIQKDGFDAFLRENIQNADAIIYAFTLRDHSMGSRFKMYDDRQFCNGLRTVTEGKPFAYIVNGDYEAEENLKTVIEARAQVGHNFLAGVGYDLPSMEAPGLRPGEPLCAAPELLWRRRYEDFPGSDLAYAGHHEGRP